MAPDTTSTTTTLSTPVEWVELDRALRKDDPSPLNFKTADVFKRVKKRGDLFAPSPA